MKDEKFYIHGMITAETLAEICRSLGDCYVVSAEGGCGICFTRKE